MTLDEAIKHCEEVAQENEKQYSGCPMKYDGAYANNDKTAGKCAKEHRQLADWLKDYKRLLEQADALDKIKRDIFNACSDNYHMPVYKLDCDKIFEIIDKYKIESGEI